MDEEDLKKPFVAVIGSFSEMVPGHVHLRELAEYVKQGVIEAGACPVNPKPSPSVTDCARAIRDVLSAGQPRADCGRQVKWWLEAHHFDAMVPGCPAATRSSPAC